ncbi:hypothetical protein [Blastococcus montanus]|uniref:hypothetical protein n=1 Tax=Blastococcus montanus TaxID=3144973 RepID=UPI00320B95CF
MALLRTVDAPPRSWRSVVVLAACVVVAVAPYLAGVLIPYYVNDLDALPLAEVASGAHDPKDLWPQGTLGGLAQLGGLLSLSLTPIVLLAVGGISAAAAVQEWHTLPVARRAPRPVAVACVVVTLVCVALLAWFFTPTASALMTWRMD